MEGMLSMTAELRAPELNDGSLRAASTLSAYQFGGWQSMSARRSARARSAVLRSSSP